MPFCKGGACPRLLGRFSPRHGRGGRPLQAAYLRARPCRIKNDGKGSIPRGSPLIPFPFPLAPAGGKGKTVGLRHPLRRGFLSGCRCSTRASPLVRRQNEGARCLALRPSQYSGHVKAAPAAVPIWPGLRCSAAGALASALTLAAAREACRKANFSLKGANQMYIRIHETETKLTITIDLGRIKNDAANADEVRSVMPVIGKLEWAAMALDAWLSGRLSPF